MGSADRQLCSTTAGCHLVAWLVGLFLLFSNILPVTQLDPVLALASVTVLLGAVLMLVMVVKGNIPEIRLLTHCVCQAVCRQVPYAYASNQKHLCLLRLQLGAP
jgi:hypothetical protein